jgi:hypothetical protein
LAVERGEATASASSPVRGQIERIRRFRGEPIVRVQGRRAVVDLAEREGRAGQPVKFR